MSQRGVQADGSDGEPRRWRMAPRGFTGLRPRNIPYDLVGGLTLAAIAIPEQMATARLAGLPPAAGFYAFIGGSLAFALFGASRRLSSGADSTIAPIFAGALTAMTASGSAHYAALAAGLALLTGGLVSVAGLFRMGWIGNLLSIPVTLGFLAGIAIHIVASQAPAVLDVPAPGGDLPQRLVALAGALPRANLACVAMATGVLAVIAVAHRLSARLPGPLVAVSLAAAAAAALHLQRRGVASVGVVRAAFSGLTWPGLSAADYVRMAPLAVLISLVIMVQTAATSRSFAPSGEQPDVDRDFLGVGAGGLLAAFLGAFPINASPPRTAIVSESGARSQLAVVVAAGLLIAVLAWARGLLGSVPQAALAGVLLFVAGRLVRVRQMAEVVRASPLESLLILATAAGIIIFPIEWGVAAGVGLSLLNGLWASVRVRLHPMRQIPGTTVWWPLPYGDAATPPHDPSVAVLAFAAPLVFLNADAFAREFLAAVRPGAGEVRLAVLEAAGMVEIDFTGAQALARVVKACHAAGVTFAVARLESLAAQDAFARLGLRDLVGADHIFESVAHAVGKRPPAS